MKIPIDRKIFDTNFTVMPNQLNYMGCIFGGAAMAELDLCAASLCRRLLQTIPDNKLDAVTWNRKGNAGMVKKGKMDLLYDDHAYELRTLKISPYNCQAALLAIDNMLKRRHEIVDSAKAAIKTMGLEWKLWDDNDFEIFANYLPDSV